MKELDDWRKLAKCGEHRDLNWWPLPSEDAAPALTVCARCPATVACLTWALSEGEVGVLGGTTEAQRSKMLMELERLAA